MLEVPAQAEHAALYFATSGKFRCEQRRNRIAHPRMADLALLNGVTAVMAEGGAICASDVRGSKPGTIHTDDMDPLMVNRTVHGVCLTGGSLFGLQSAFGIMRWGSPRTPASTRPSCARWPRWRTTPCSGRSSMPFGTRNRFPASRLFRNADPAGTTPIMDPGSRRLTDGGRLRGPPLCLRKFPPLLPFDYRGHHVRIELRL